MNVWKDQVWHFLLLAILLLGVFYVLRLDEGILEGSLWSVPTKTWFIIALLSPIIHQIYVVVLWRIELYNKGLTKLWGDKAFIIFKVLFAILILSRPVSIILLAISNAFTINIGTSLSIGISLILFFPAVYLFYSVKKYFGMDRAFGLDHFEPEKVKNMPMVKEGMFKYTSNGMYVFGFFMLWIPGILGQSSAALMIALFSHIYIWVHFYFTELPDMKFIYNDKLSL